MDEKKTQKFFRPDKYGRYLTVYVYIDPDVGPGILMGRRYVVITVNKDLTRTEIDSYINKLLDLDPTCVKCRRRSSYFRAEIANGNIDNIVCGICDPAVKFAVAYFEVIDPLIAPH